MAELIAAASLIVAVIALWKSDRAQREANAVQRRIVEIEEQREQDRVGESRRADLRASLQHGDRGSSRLYIENVGHAEARNVNLLLDGEPFLEHRAVPKGEQLALLIGPKAEVSYCLALTTDCHPPFELAITWDDDDGTAHPYRTRLTF